MDDLVRSVIELARHRLPAQGGAVLDDPDADLSSLGLDSLAVVRLVVDLERELLLEFPADALEPATFRTVNSIVATIRALPKAADGQ